MICHQCFGPESARRAATICSLIFLCLSTMSAPAAAETPQIIAAHAAEPPILDGVFDDLCWLMAPRASGFVESSPETGAQPAFDTDLRVAVDADALYLAFRAHTGDPDALVTSVMQRDGAILRSDDYFIFLLDTFHDHRDAYYFMVNAAGVQSDGRLIDEGVTIDGSWDGTWRVATRRGRRSVSEKHF
ncbi:MAG: carbohydrate binding family 9 domain-containing protein [Gemmatimonadetes bacterium]|jgi:hypothetical protein|nr:carbohydrate binding family 9 domain-containing protein [Gemmatimonadota bacterium]MBT4612335.1 carbohydrate binding family 9 domain-containing protein [Gemmatimonadota bacterium]MBT5059095.1 carbohydrate binding family 9 domain-containing protein [Gemmatimonadota bacterium]MBT5145695.1 carbohydrate binding family 9 domain-containing protein [Gemmatimonadota bacterium]MBT5588075.1 carbohydrate binding family 9 domain-containing protein [Gemmatimonadota bacterium]